MPEGYSFPAIPRRMMAGNEQGEKWLDQFQKERAAGNREDSLGILG
jgi:hypothetical protein